MANKGNYNIHLPLYWK